ncbi:MAG: DUF2914 domain-containing protein [Thioalkalispiraceae bacterium]|jgi:hypothetical protein
MFRTTLLVFTSLLYTSLAIAEEMPANTVQENTQPAVEQPTSDTNADNAPVAGETTAPAATEELTAQSGFSRGSVMRSVFTSGIENREPVDDLETAGGSGNSITYFTELRDMSGQTAKHRWEHNGKVMAEVEFNVRGPRWRVWSSKALMPQWQGEWKVSVINAADEVISEEVIQYQPVAEEAAPVAEPPNNTDLVEPSAEPAQPANAQ